jgi:hypothetical protein
MKEVIGAKWSFQEDLGGIFEIYRMSGMPWYERQGHMRNL